MPTRKSLLLNFTRFGDNNLSGSLTTLSTKLFHFADDGLTVENLTEDSVLAIEPRCFLESDKELRAISVLTGVGHGQQIGTGVLDSKVLIRETRAIDGFSAHTVAHGKITTLQ